MGFQERLDRAIQRGRQAKDEVGRKAAADRLTEAEFRNLHSRARVELSEHVDGCLHAIADRFPGFTFKTLAGDEGWGARITRDDVQLRRGAGETVFSRFEIVIRPFSAAHIAELTVKGTIRNGEAINRGHFQRLEQLDLDSFVEQIDLWVLDYAEKFAAS